MNKEVVILCVGKIKEQFYRDICEADRREICKQAAYQIIEADDEKIPENCSTSEAERVKENEADRLLTFIHKNDFLVCLCIEGKPFDNEKMKKLIDRELENEKRIVFVIGGSLGLHEKIVKRADAKMSFSNMTYPHQLMRVILSEQIRKAICGK